MIEAQGFGDITRSPKFVIYKALNLVSLHLEFFASVMCILSSLTDLAEAQIL